MKKNAGKRAEPVRDRIANALIELLKTEDYSDITVVEIIERAQAGRISFYRNFRDKDDVMRHYITTVTDKWLSGTDENYITLTQNGIRPYIIFLLSHMLEHREVIELLLKNGKMYLLEEEFDRRFFFRLADTDSPWEVVYKVGGVYKLFFGGPVMDSGRRRKKSQSI